MGEGKGDITMPMARFQENAEYPMLGHHLEGFKVLNITLDFGGEMVTSVPEVSNFNNFLYIYTTI